MSMSTSPRTEASMLIPQPLDHYFSLNRRYYRSIDLERDFDVRDALAGYVPTDCALKTLVRILPAIGVTDRHRAWTLTGVYGTGKSAFLQYFLALCAQPHSAIRAEAIAVTATAFGETSDEYRALVSMLPVRPVFRAVARGRSEPLSRTIARALIRGGDAFWSGSQTVQHAIARTLQDWDSEIDDANFTVSDDRTLSILKEITQEADADLILTIDELGKNLEYAARHRGTSDLYLLQQIAELKLRGDHQVYFVGVLHQDFSGYSDRLSGQERNEWSKVQGRFENIAYSESPHQMTRLLGQSIVREAKAEGYGLMFEAMAAAWLDRLDGVVSAIEVSASAIARAMPLHPLTAIILPELCLRYAQNDRSLFAFMTSDEPYGFRDFLAVTDAAIVDGELSLPLLQIHQVYDYFVESSGGMASRLNLQRWVEVQTLIRDRRTQDADLLKLLKTIGILNLVTTGGAWRASPELVVLALCDRLDNAEARQYWLDRIDAAQRSGLLIYRKLVNELRIWEGSDFNVELAVDQAIERDRQSLVALLSHAQPLSPLVAQRHYTQTGILRYFERCYADREMDLTALSPANAGADGMIVYWLDCERPSMLFDPLPATTADGKPLMIVATSDTELLLTRGRELWALEKILRESPELGSDRVARKEVQFRITAAARLLEDGFERAFDWSSGRNDGWAAGRSVVISSERAFRGLISDLCDRAYERAWRIDNELIDRRQLTSQGAKALRVLLEGAIERGDCERFDLEGYGPEVAIYESVLRATGVHRCEAGVWGFFAPPEASGLATVWEAIEWFCLAATVEPRSLAELYAELMAPPYGLKPGAIPLVIAAVLLHYSDDVGLYKDGTFIPVLGSEHFELLVKDPARFAVKYFEIAGVRSSVFRVLEGMLRSPQSQVPAGVRNVSLLMITKPLFGFVKRLPKYTLRTSRVSSESRAVLRELQNAQEPDALLFSALPQVCGFAPFVPTELDDEAVAAAFRQRLMDCLQELQMAYEQLLADCQVRLRGAFGIGSEGAALRPQLVARAERLRSVCVEPVLKRFLAAAADGSAVDSVWIEAIAMVVVDKPPKAWLDVDVVRFEVALSDLARRFGQLEALSESAVDDVPGDVVARRLTVTRQDGGEVNRLVWVDRDRDAELDVLVERVLSSELLTDNTQLQEAFLVRLSERILSRGDRS